MLTLSPDAMPMERRHADGTMAATGMLVVALAATAATAAATAAEQDCRCVPPMPCWNNVPWKHLNTSVSGRLRVSEDELASCLPAQGGSLTSTACAADLASTDDEFWLSSKPNGYQHTGLFNVWNTSRVSEYSVLAETEEDMQATVKFAHDHNLRLVVKNTGHDWYGRSTAPGSLLLWTHLRKNITFHEGFVAEGCDASTAHDAVRVGSGVQFMDLYPAALQKDRIVMGGTCDSVGVAGCWTAGCYGPFTKRFGNGAINILEARVVLADGSLVTASKCSHPDLFMSIRGGAGGLAGVVTEFTARSHRAPEWTSVASFHGSAGNLADCQTLFKEVLMANAHTAMHNSAGELCDNGGLNWQCDENGGSVSLNCLAYEGEPAAMKAQLQPLGDWAAAQNRSGGSGSTIKGSVSGGVQWNNTHKTIDPTNKEQVRAALPPGMIELHPDREISTALLASMSKFFPARACMAKESCAQTLAESLVKIQALTHSLNGTKPTDCFMGAKGQGGLSEELTAEFHTTGLNPVLLDATGTYLIMHNIPSLPQIPPSPQLLKAIWPRLQQYAVTEHDDPLASVCEAGAAGDQAASVACFDEWHSRIPALQAKLEVIRQAMWAALPNEDSAGKPFSGSYWCETDYDDLDFRVSHWGMAYPKLLAVKDKYDPDGLFICHHCVGSERWTKESGLNCRAPNTTL